jgi:hypothetical protein
VLNVGFAQITQTGGVLGKERDETIPPQQKGKEE